MSAIKTKIFKGKDAYDLDIQLWNWRLENPHHKNVKEYIDEDLFLESSPHTKYDKIIFPDTVVRKIDYQD